MAVGFSEADDMRIDSIAAATRTVSRDGDPGYHTLRWFVSSGGNRYISEDITGDGYLADSTTNTMVEFDTLLWQQSSVSEGSAAAMYIDSGDYTVSSSSLTNIQDIGFVVQGDGRDGRNAHLYYHEIVMFQVYASEPPPQGAVFIIR